MSKKLLRHLQIGLLSFLISLTSYAKTVIAIDAGHGGKDPGAIGKNLGIKEKDITLSIAKELATLLNNDSNFKAILTRTGDYFIPAQNRTEIARKNKADYLISIHADSSPISKNLKGASVWVLSNRRANDELGKWLEDHEKQSELLGGAGSVLASDNERYLNQTVLDLQFSHSQRSGYELGKRVLGKMSQVTSLVKKAPQHASLSVLRSPDIPSILVETGFLSNATEEQKLASAAYRRQIARSIYQGLVEYRKKNPTYAVPKNNTAEKKSTKSDKNSKSVEKETSNKSTAKSTEKEKNTKEIDLTAKYHTVQINETLYSIARMYKTTPEKLIELNNIKNNRILVGAKLKLK